MRPEEYVKWQMLNAHSITIGMDSDDIEDLEAYVQEWARRHLGEGEAESKAGEMHPLFGTTSLHGSQLP
jgi:hypothetical protein